MKEEKRFYWLVKLRNCNYKKRTFRESKAGCKSDFERVVGVSSPNKDFRKFLNELIKLNILEFFDHIEAIGGMIPSYTINETKIMKEIKKMEFANKFYKACVDDYLSLNL